jgi:hypothetical protein
MDKKARMPARQKTASALWILWARRVHLYSGVLFAPAILFFAITGLVQVFDLHKSSATDGYRAPELVQRLAALHKDQTFALPHKDDAPKKRDRADPGGSKTVGKPPIGPAQALIKVFAALAATGLAASTLLGLYIAYRFNRGPWLVTGLLIAGAALPLAVIAIGAR